MRHCPLFVVVFGLLGRPEEYIRVTINQKTGAKQWQGGKDLPSLWFARALFTSWCTAVEGTSVAVIDCDLL